MTATQAMMEPVAIIGMGCLFPGADGPRRYWANIAAGVDSITEVPASHWRPEDYFNADPTAPDHTYARRGGFLSPVEFAPLEFGITPNSLEATDTTQLLALLAARQALEDAGYGTERDFDRERASVILGVTGALPLVVSLGARLGHPIWRQALRNAGVEGAVADQVMNEISQGYVGWQEDSFPGLLGNVVAGRIANRLNLGGTNCVVDAACASSLSALHMALLELSSGRCDLALSGGMDTFNDIFMYMCFSKTPALSPTGNARPFDAQGDGTILGEGLGCVVLKRLADAERDGDKIYAVIKGIGTSSDGKGQAIYAPSPQGQAEALRQAYRLAGVTPDTIELVEAHGTGTRAGDAAEVTALTDVFQTGHPADSKHHGNGSHHSPLTTHHNSPWCALGSVKSQIGHTKAAAGVAGLIKAVLALHHKVLPPTIKVDKPIDVLAPGNSPFYVNRDKRPWLPRHDAPRRAGVSAFGFGGSNFHCVLEEHQPDKSAASWDGSVQIAAFSASQTDEIKKNVDAILAASSWSETCRLAAESRASFVHTDPHRLLFVLRQDQDTGRLRAQIQTQWARNGTSTWSLPDGAYYGSGAVPGKLALLFPGQGSQYVNMLRDLSCHFPELLDTLAEANGRKRSADTKPSARLSDLIYPPSAFSDPERQAQETALRATDVAQPALGATSLGLLRVLRHFGIQPDVVAGHSFGELTALCAAGRLSETEFLDLAVLRGRLMAGASAGQGGMLAVQMAADELTTILEADHIDLVIANRNAPTQTVLSGALQEIDRATHVFEKRGIRLTRLPVGAAFHSPQVAGVAEPFLERLESVPLPAGSMSVFANTTGQAYPDSPDRARTLLANQLAAPVLFVDMIANMHAAGARTFVEVGPGNKLTGLVRSILDGKPFHAIAVDASAGKASGTGDLARTFAQLAALGHRVDLTLWDPPGPAVPARKPGLMVPLTGINYRKPRPAPSTPSVPQATGHGNNEYNNGKVGSGSTVGRAGAKPVDAGRSENGTVVPTRNNAAPLSRPESPKPPERGLATGRQATREPIPMTDERILALQRITEQTAQLHRQFLEGQDRALQVLQAILLQQQGVSANGSVPQLAAPAPVALPPARVKPEAPRPQPKVVSPAPVKKIAAAPPKTAALPKPQHNGHADGWSKILLEVVAEKTGYPIDMIELDMEMDTDLGIDSIKRVEIFSVLQERLPDAPAVRSEHLASLRTLRDVTGFLGQNGTTTATPAPRPVAASRNGHAPPAAQKVLLDTIAEKTGYPPEMLELDMEMDTDLGIDSIKRVEIFSALQDRLPDVPPIKGEQLGTLRTLRQVLEFLTPAEAPHTNGTASVNGTHHVQRNGDREKPAAPLPVPFRPTLENLPERLVLTAQSLSAAPRRKRTVASGEILIICDPSALAHAIADRLHHQGHAARIVPVSALLSDAVPADLGGVLVLAPSSGTDADFLWKSLRTVQKLSPALRKPGAGPRVLMTVSCLDGGFGLLNSAFLKDPVSGGLAGLAKTAAREWPEVACKAIDLSPELPVEQAAHAVADELALDGPTEVGITPDGVCSLRLTSIASAPMAPLPLESGDVILITGGARGVTAEAALALASAAAPALVLLGRTPLPAAEPSWLTGLNDEASIKRALHRQSPGDSPRSVNEKYREILAHREVRRNLERLASAGAAVHYRQVDVRDPVAVRRLCDGIRAEFGPIRGLVHGAGVLADRRIEDKTEEQFRSVVATKVTGLQNLLAALETDSLKLLALFSSSTARFGRSGQADYAIANEVLNKIAQAESRHRPDCRVVAFNWGPWDGGMVQPGLKKLFADEGITLIPLDAGADFFVRELCQPHPAPVEVVVLGSGSRIEASIPTVSEPPQVPHVNGAAKAATNGKHAAVHRPLTLAFSQSVSVANHPVLASHVIGGQAVVPLALVIEWLAHGALHAHPGLVFNGLDDVHIFRGIKLRENAACTVEVFAGKAVKKDGVFHVPVELHGRVDAHEPVLHAGATVILASSLPAPDAADPLPTVDPCDLSMADVYRDILFHGPALHGLEQIDGLSDQGMLAQSRSAPAPAQWIEHPLRPHWLTDPLILDGSFQMMVLWAHQIRGTPSLPCAIGSYRQYRRSFPATGARIVVRVTSQGPQHITADITYLDDAGAPIARATTYECVLDPSLPARFRENQLHPDAIAVR